MKYFAKCVMLLVAFLITVSYCQAQTNYSHYNVDSLLKKLSVNKEVGKMLHTAAGIYKQAGISKDNISIQAFKMAYLEKCFLDSGQLRVKLPKDSVSLPYSNKDILTIIDFTKNGKHKRWLTVSLSKRKIVYNTLVSHGAATGKGSEVLINKFGWKKENINDKYSVPLFFGNADSSYRSSLGLVLCIEGSYPDNPCHLCKYFLEKPHKCGVILAGLEEHINDNDMDREIVIHTTGSKDFSDSISAAKIGTMITLTPENINGLKKKNCGCAKSTNSVSSYASSCGIKENKGFIGRSSGCFVLPEERHRPIMETIESGSLIFVYSNIIAPTGTNYFEESPVIKQIIAYVGNP
jgi:hypothetical protein